ncbi:MAG: hypothetical protein RLZZ502_1602 [Pseudomonadota bacterium]|jgi:multiple sugar transport system permease protein
MSASSQKPWPLLGNHVLAKTLMLLVLLVTLLPLWFAFKTALMHPSVLFEQASDLWLTQPTTMNFKRVLGGLSAEESRALGGSGAELNILRALGNSLMFTAIIVVLQLSSAAMSAYAFARLQFPGKQWLFAAFVASMMVPGVVTFIPNFVLIRDLGLLNSMAGMVAPFCLMQGFSVFFLRQFFLSLPREMEEAALLEGASYFTIFWRIIIPLSGTALATTALLIGINSWNEFFWPYLVAPEASQQVLPVALQTFKAQTPQGQPDWTGLMAATCVAVVPVIMLLLLLGKQVVESLQHTGGK